jgi:hypothetical protein
VIFDYCSSGHLATEGVIAALAAAPGSQDREAWPVPRGLWGYGQVGPDVPRRTDPAIDEELPWRSA